MLGRKNLYPVRFPQSLRLGGLNDLRRGKHVFHSLLYDLGGAVCGLLLSNIQGRIVKRSYVNPEWDTRKRDIVRGINKVNSIHMNLPVIFHFGSLHGDS